MKGNNSTKPHVTQGPEMIMGSYHSLAGRKPVSEPIPHELTADEVFYVRHLIAPFIGLDGTLMAFSPDSPSDKPVVVYSQ